MLNYNKRVLILCEDSKSSLDYFKSFQKDEKYKRNLSAWNIEIYQPENYSPLGLVEEAKKKQKRAKQDKNEYDKIWIVLDKDKHANIKDALNTITQLKNIEYALSIICFEYWILLHFEKTTKAFETGDKIINYIKSKHFPEYDKGICCYDTLIDKINTAITNGEWVVKTAQYDLDRGTNVAELGAYTNVHELVKELIKPKEKIGL
ncbi:MAG: RloB family protein [bacterium]